MRVSPVVALSLLLLPLAAGAQIEPLGAEFMVNTFVGYGQSYPTVATGGTGSSIVAWTSGRDGDGGVFAQRYDSAGQAAGSEFQVNTQTLDYQGRPAAAAASDGSFVIAWQSQGQDGSDLGVFGQRYDSAGQPAGTEFQANTFTLSSQGDTDDPGVAMAADGSFVVTWSSGQDGDAFGVFGQRFDSGGQKVGGEFQANTYTIDNQYNTSVGIDGNGAFLVTWMGQSRDGDSLGVFGRYFDGAGQPVGADFQVNTYTPSDQAAPSVAAGAGGGFVVTWMSAGQDGDGFGVFAKRYDSAGQPTGGEFQANTYTPGSQSYIPSVAVGGDGSFVIVWPDSDLDGDSGGIFGRRFNSAGQAQGAAFQVNDYTLGGQYVPVIAAGPAGGFVVAWQDDGQNGIFAQRFGSAADCGNSVLDPGEQCDDGNNVDGDTGCDSNCTFTACGNGILTTGEECDDGNLLDGDGCSSTCQDAAPPDNASAQLLAGQMLSTDGESDGATPQDPIETSITLSAGTVAAMVGTVSATIGETTGPGPSVPGYSFFGQQVQIDVTCTNPPCASPTLPMTLQFRVDASRVPAGVDENTFAIFRDGALVPACSGSPGVASPDPCVDERQLFNDGDIGATILTSLASEWSFAASACSPAPLSCGNPGKAIFQVKKSTGDPSATKLISKWLKGTISGPSEFGDPIAGTSFELCVYDGSSLVESHGIAGGGDCGGDPCWKPVGTKGFKYKNTAGNDDGITKVLLKSGSGKAKILVKAKGSGVVTPDTDPIYTQAPSVTVQLVGSNGSCWQAVYPGGATVSTGEQFKDKMP
jgi:cysteine-rich repeat protein